MKIVGLWRGNMKEHIDLIMGLVAGLALTFLNNDAVHDSISYVFTLLTQKTLNFYL